MSKDIEFYKKWLTDRGYNAEDVLREHEDNQRKYSMNRTSEKPDTRLFNVNLINECKPIDVLFKMSLDFVDSANREVSYGELSRYLNVSESTFSIIEKMIREEFNKRKQDEQPKEDKQEQPKKRDERFMTPSEREYRKAVDYCFETDTCNAYAIRLFLRVGDKRSYEIVEQMIKDEYAFEEKVNKNNVLNYEKYHNEKNKD